MTTGNGRGQQTPTDMEFSNFYCCAEWHLAKLSGLCAVLYTFALRLSKHSRYFTVSAASVAKYFGVSSRTAQRAYQELRESGFFILVKSGKPLFEPSTYRVSTHNEWAAKHPGKCTEKFSYPWTGEGDPLGQRLWLASGSQVRFMPFQVEALRKTGIPDDEIISLFEGWYAAYEVHQQGKKWRKYTNVHFLAYLRTYTRAGADPSPMTNRTPKVVQQLGRSEVR